MRLVAVVAVVTLCGPVTSARAQPTITVIDIEVPAIIERSEGEDGGVPDDALDLANVVQSAAKGITTVQEAPAIVTVITADEIRDRQFQDLGGVINTVPGWQTVGIYNGTFPTPLARGQTNQFLHDGLSLFEPYVNASSINQVQPMELFKRVEMITGPGGVLWGSNSLIGIVNVITKDAEDVNGVEVGGELGDGSGNHMYARAYAMAGATNVLGSKLKLFAHAAFTTYQGNQLELPLLLFHNALPQPNSLNVYGPLTATDAPQSMITTVDAKIAYDGLQLRVYAPFGAKYNPAGLSGEPVRKGLAEDPQCPTGTSDMRCVDPGRVNRANREDVFDRYAVLEYRMPFADRGSAITARVYGLQFVRGLQPLQVLSPSESLPGGLAVETDQTSYRVGTSIDGDLQVGSSLRVLYGGEAFREWKPEDVTGSLQGPGSQSELLGPYNPALVPLPCPRIYNAAAVSAANPSGLVPIAGCPLTAAFPASRTVFGAYLDPQYRPTKELIFDLGGRVQVAPPSLGTLSYDLNTTVAATVVWNFVPNWHLKLNYGQGFRPPVFNSTTANGEAVQIGGNPKLKVETSDAFQAEINARIFKGERRIRELTFRVDGSYTRVDNLITISSGTYANSGARGVASLEFLGKLYLQGGHRVELGYTYLRGDATDIGRMRSFPENSFTLSGVWRLLGSTLTATTTLRVTGATEDPNRLVEYRGLTVNTRCDGTDPACAPGLPAGTVSVLPTDMVMDRLPPVADLTVGLQYMPSPKIAIRATAYNALASHAYQPDLYFDYEPHLEYLPNAYEGFRAILSASYQY